MLKHLAVIEFAVLTISQKHSEIHTLIDKEKSERLSSAVMELMEVLDEIDYEYNDQLSNGGDILEGSVLPVSQSKKTNS